MRILWALLYPNLINYALIIGFVLMWAIIPYINRITNQKYPILQQYFFTPLLYQSPNNNTRTWVFGEFIDPQKVRFFIMLLIGSSLFLLPILNAWMLFPILPRTDILYGSMGGVIPWSDALMYYEGANHLLETGRLEYFGSRRPLNAILFAFRLWISKGNFEFALIIQALLCGLSVSILSSLISKYFGRLAVILGIIPIFAFSMNYIPITMSETLGLTLGCLAFVLLWTGVLEKKISLAVAGIFMLTVGLNARAGAFFVLPLLIIWMGRAFSSPTRKYNWQAFNLGVVALGLAFLFNLLLTVFYGKLSGPPHANFTHTLFGLASGGKGWTYACQVYAKECVTLGDDIARFLFVRSLELIKTNPFSFIEALLKNGKEAIDYLCSLDNSNIVIYSSLIITIIMIVVKKTGLLLFCYGTWKIKSHYKTNKVIFELISIGIIGSLLSACVIWNDGGLRSFAVTLPFFAVAFGSILSLVNAPTPPMLGNKTSSHWEGSLSVTICGIIITLGLLSPLMFRSGEVHPPSSLQTPIKLSVRNISKFPYMTILNDSKKTLRFPSFTHFIDQKSFIKLNPSWSDSLPIFLELLDPKKFKQPITIGVVYDRTYQRNLYIVGPRSIFVSKKKEIELYVEPMVSSHKNNCFADNVFIIRSELP